MSIANSSATVDSTVCQNALPLTWNGVEFSLTDTVHMVDNVMYVSHSVVIQSATGGDSVVEMRLYLNKISYTTATDTINENQMPYVWNGIIYDSIRSGGARSLLLRDTVTLPNVYGCDSVIYMSLLINFNTVVRSDTAVCQSSLPIVWHGFTFPDTAITNQTSPVTLSDTITYVDSRGADSLLVYNVTVHPIYDIYDTVEICESMFPYTWRDTVISNIQAPSPANESYYTFQLSRHTVNNCDSLMTLYLAVDSNTYASLHFAVTENELPFSWNGMVFDTEMQDSVFTIQNMVGCDSIVSLNLTVYWNVRTTLTQTVCDNELPYTWNGITFGYDGLSGPAVLMDSVSLSSSTGADSTVVMSLIVNPTYRIDEVDHICANELPYIWHDTVLNGEQITEDGDSLYIIRSLSTVGGCDSVMSLTLMVSSVYNTVDSVESCDPIVWLDGKTYSISIRGPYMTLQSQNGCDSVVVLDFHIIEPVYTYIVDSFCINTIYHFAGQEITTAGTYFDTLQSAVGCDSIVSLTLTQMKQPTITITTEPDCEMHRIGVSVETNGHYIWWSCESLGWDNDWGPRNGKRIWVNPPIETTWTVLCDYYEESTCPNTQSITLEPLQVPVAQMSITPERLNDDNNQFFAFDRSLNSVTRTWWIDGVFYGDDRQIVCTPAADVDTVSVMMIAESEYCFDTAFRIVPVYHSSLFAPNVFTPDETSNQEFFIVMDGVQDFEIWIYNRSGVLIFHTVDKEAKWDGTFKGHPCPQENYVWIVKYTTEENPLQPKIMKGSVLLLR